MSAALAAELADLAVAVGLDAYGVTSADDLDAARETIVERKSRGLHGGMHFTYGRPERSTSPRRHLQEARSVLVGARAYHRVEPPDPTPTRPRGRIAAYQWDDHYDRLRSGLDALADHLRAAGHEALVLVDDNRMVDRAAAHRAGLGWFGKNTNLLLTDGGSMFVLGTVVTDADLAVATAPVPDGCGPCTRCQTACPTGALDVAGELDARRCLAWLVQADGVFPEPYRVALGDRIYGCDDCQDACPPNRVVLRSRAAGSESVASERVRVDVIEMLNLPDDELMRRYGHWYVPRRRPDYLRRNALVVLGNVADPDDPATRDALTRSLAGPPLVAAHAVWAARRLGLDHLIGLVVLPDDDIVSTEVHRAVDPRPGVAV